MNYLLLGGNGFIGFHLIDKLLSEGHSVRIYDKNADSLLKYEYCVDFRLGKFSDHDLLVDAINNIDVAVHLISTTLPKTSNDDPAFDIQSNLVESIFLLEQCVANGIKKIVFVSSGGTVYGQPEKLPIDENGPTNPLCSYGITKLAIEKYLSLYNHLYGLDYVVLRPSNAYGERQNLKSIQGAIAVFLGKVARNEPIIIWGDGEVVRDYVYIDDLVEGIFLAATTKSSSRIFNLGSGMGHSLNQVIEIIQQSVGRDLKVVYKEKRVFDVPSIYLDISLARKELLWFPKTSLERGILKTWEYVECLSK